MPHEIWKFENGKHIIIDVRNNHASDTKCEQMMEVECHAAHQPQILNFSSFLYAVRTMYQLCGRKSTLTSSSIAKF